MSHNEKRHAEVIALYGMGPPSSPPIVFERLNNKMKIATAASVQNIVTEKARLKQIQIVLQSGHVLKFRMPVNSNLISGKLKPRNNVTLRNHYVFLN